MNDNWQAASPILANHGYCVFAFNDGGSSPNADFHGTGEIAASAGQLASFVTQVQAATGASKVDFAGHSQGGMMPRYYLKFLGGAAYVSRLVGLAPSNHGTTVDGLTTLTQDLGLSGVFNVLIDGSCEACVQQEAGSVFLAQLNAGGDTVQGVRTAGSRGQLPRLGCVGLARAGTLPGEGPAGVGLSSRRRAGVAQW
jgi:triacylglycerol esterase/lipase EstA (alpha/beta hydrolase family)